MFYVKAGHCILCGKQSEEFLDVGDGRIPIHRECFELYSDGEDFDLAKFETYQEWKEFAGSEYDLMSHIWEYPNGSKYWYLNGEPHREDGPAIERSGGRKEWWLNGKRHREDGPAIEYPGGTREWLLNNEKLTEQEFLKRKKYK